MRSFWDRLESQFRAAWERTDDLFGLLKPEALRAQPIIWRHPFIFYVGHLPAFAWNQAYHSLLRRSSVNSRFDDIFSRGIDPDIDTGTCHSHPEVPQSSPDLAEVIDYRDTVREAVLERRLMGDTCWPHSAELSQLVPGALPVRVREVSLCVRSMISLLRLRAFRAIARAAQQLSVKILLRFLSRHVDNVRE